MARILLLAPPYLDLYGNLKTAAGRYFPLGLGYIASYLRKYGGHEVRMYEPEAQRLSRDDILKLIREFSPEVIGITCATPNFMRAIELARSCKTISSAIVIIGGVHASAIPEFIIERYADCIDSVVVGEGEKTMLALVSSYEQGTPLEHVNGLAYMKDDQVIRTGQRDFIEDLDSLPFPARDLIPQDLFAPNMHNARYRNCMTILTSRGCPFNCSFCAARIVSGKKYRMHSPEYVLTEMEMLKKDYCAKQLIITDDTFTINHDRLERICRGMINKKLNLSWFCFSQVTTVNREILELMKAAGCYSIGFGIESADAAILKQMGKPITPEKAKETVKTSNKLGLKTQAFYILGSPGETRTQMEKTIAFSRDVNAVLSFYNMLVPYPGTREFDHYFSGMPLEKIEWENFVAVGEHCVLERSALPAADLQAMIARANTNYYLHPLRILNLLRHIRTPYELANYLRGGISLVRQILTWSNQKRN
jgi:anaerobic magnesium-protoporphyrin IX monomethyl ester cyclase